jgi:hypothetical protein
MKRQRVKRVAAVLALLCAGAVFHSSHACAQVFDFGQIDAFESLGSGTQQGGAQPKTIVDDGERHTVLFTIFESDTDAKIYWKSPEGRETTLMHGPGVKAFQTTGEFRIEALGDDKHSFKYGYVLLKLKSSPKNTKGT